MGTTKDIIINNSIDLMLNTGFDKIRFKDIAKSSFIAPSTLRYYFENKDAIGLNILNIFYKNFSKRVIDIRKNSKARSLIEQVINIQCYYYKILFSNTNLLNLIYRLLMIDSKDMFIDADVFSLADNITESKLNMMLTKSIFFLIVNEYKNEKADEIDLISFSCNYYLKMIFGFSKEEIPENINDIVSQCYQKNSIENIDIKKEFFCEN